MQKTFMNIANFAMFYKSVKNVLYKTALQANH